MKKIVDNSLIRDILIKVTKSVSVTCVMDTK